MASERTVVVRRLAAGAASLVLTGRMYGEFHFNPRASWVDMSLGALIVSAPMIATLLVWSRRLGLQLLARATWWSFLIMGLLGACVTGAHEDGRHPAIVAACAGAALLAIGRGGLREEATRFKPVAFRGTLQLSLVLAMADTAALALCGLVLTIPRQEAARGALVLALAACTGLGVFGLLRLRTWGLLVAFASNLLVGMLALTKHLPLPEPLRVLFVATASLQAIVPLPMIVTLVRRRPPPPDRWQAFRRVGANVAILGLVALGLYAGFISQTPLFPLDF